MGPKNKQMFEIAIIALFLVMACTSVNIAGSSVNRDGENVKKDGAVIPIKQIIDAPADYEGKEVRLQGVFLGWKGGCASSVMLTRSDWVLQDDSGCVYVTGRLPDAVSPATPKGESIQVIGRVLVNKKGGPTIQAVLPIVLKK